MRRSEPLPLPWEQARPAVARGLAALAAGLALELLLRGVARGVRNLPAVTRLDRGEARSTQDVEERVEVWSQTTFVRRVRRLRSGGAR